MRPVRGGSMREDEFLTFKRRKYHTKHLHACRSFQLVDGDGIFYKDRLDKFTEKLKLANCGNSYSIISIIGPQSSGKSTLLNRLFGTNFKEMNAQAKIGRTTRGIWLASCSGAKGCTLVLDLEGTDGVERARTQTPPEIFEDLMHKDVKELWESVEKPRGYKQTELSEIFNVEVQILPNYEFFEETFKEQVAIFRERLSLALEGGEGCRDHQALVPGSGFSASAEKIWKSAKENKDFDVPSHKEFIAIKRCEDVATERFNAFIKSKKWHQLLTAAHSGSARSLELGVKMNDMFHACLNEWDYFIRHKLLVLLDTSRVVQV